MTNATKQPKRVTCVKVPFEAEYRQKQKYMNMKNASLLRAALKTKS